GPPAEAGGHPGGLPAAPERPARRHQHRAGADRQRRRDVPGAPAQSAGRSARRPLLGLRAVARRASALRVALNRMRAAFLTACVLLAGAFDAGSPVQAPVRPSPDPSQRFSTLTAITPSNVARLTVAWTAHTGEFAGGRGRNPGRPVPGFQTRPVLAG